MWIKIEMACVALLICIWFLAYLFQDHAKWANKVHKFGMNWIGVIFVMLMAAALFYFGIIC